MNNGAPAMTFNLPLLSEPTPKGKRSLRRNAWGNINGHVSGRFWVTFGAQFDPVAERDAEAWLAEGAA